MADIADSVSVMHRGEIVEYGTVFDILEHPKMDYTRHLLENSSTQDVRVVALDERIRRTGTV